MRVVSPSFIGCTLPFSDARIVIFGIPFEGRVNLRKGADAGPRDVRLGSESIETYSPALVRDLEDLAMQFDGVRQAYAIQAGREVRVIVDAKLIDDKLSAKIARDISKRIEQEMTYPGEIKVTVLREVRSVEYAR